MLYIDESTPSIIHTIGLDPGTVQLGVSIFKIDLNTYNIINIEAFTLNGGKLLGHDLIGEHYGDRHSRIWRMCDYLLNIFKAVTPFAVVTEMPFFYNARPQAFEALMDVISALRNTLWSYDNQIPLIGIDPSTIKNTVGAKGGADKITIADSISKIDILKQVDISILDEHAIDAVAVNYWYYCKHILRVI